MGNECAEAIATDPIGAFFLDRLHGGYAAIGQKNRVNAVFPDKHFVRTVHGIYRPLGRDMSRIVKIAGKKEKIFRIMAWT
jgi:hypothetical protein